MTNTITDVRSEKIKWRSLSAKEIIENGERKKGKPLWETHRILSKRKGSSRERNKRTCSFEGKRAPFFLYLSGIRTMYRSCDCFCSRFLYSYLWLTAKWRRFCARAISWQQRGRRRNKNLRILFQHQQYQRANHPTSNGITRTNKRYFKIYSWTSTERSIESIVAAATQQQQQKKVFFFLMRRNNRAGARKKGGQEISWKWYFSRATNEQREHKTQKYIRFFSFLLLSAACYFVVARMREENWRTRENRRYP